MSTTFGSSAATPREAAAHLRARASRHGLVLCDVPAPQLAGAVIAAEFWCAVLGASTLEVAGAGTQAADVLAAAFTLAATGVAPLDYGATCAISLERLQEAHRSTTEWLMTWFESYEDRRAALLSAQRCLCAGGPGTSFAAAGDVLVDLSELLADH